MKPGKDGADLELTLLLHPTTDSGPEENPLDFQQPEVCYILPEEDLGVTQPELLLVQLDDVHHSSSGSLVVLGLGHCSSTQDVVACFKLRIVDLQNKKIIKKII